MPSAGKRPELTLNNIKPEQRRPALEVVKNKTITKVMEI